MEQIDRITKMEQYFDEAEGIVRDFAESLEAFMKVQGHIRKLAKYYDGGEWLKDFDDDNAGKLPSGLKRGVLSEDGLYDLLSENDEQLTRIIVEAHKILNEGMK